MQVLPPHTVVEYFGMSPVERIPLGRTTKSVDEFRSFLRSVASRYTAATYDLFRNNCNNFTDVCARYLLGSPIPDRILSVPDKVLSTPMGASIGAMWSGMQGTMAARMGRESWDPFTGGAGVPPPAAPAPVVAAPAPPLGGSGGSGGSSILAAAIAPLIAADAGNVPGLVARLRAVDAALPPESPHRLSVADTALIDGLPAWLGAATGDAPAAAAAAAVATRCLRTWPRSTAAFPLLAVMRLLVLRDAAAGVLTGADGAGDKGALWDVLETAATAEGYGSAAPNLMALSTLANTFKTGAGCAWATAPHVAALLIQVVCANLGAPRADTRQLAGALAYNLALRLPVGSDTAGAGDASSAVEGDATVLVTDASVQLLCACLDGVAGEADGEVARRRLLAAGRLIQREGKEAGALVATLGFREPVDALAASSTAPPALRALATEVAALIVDLPGAL